MLKKQSTLKEEVIRMIEIVNPKETGLLKAYQMAIIDTQANYYYNELMEMDKLEVKILTWRRNFPQKH